MKVTSEELDIKRLKCERLARSGVLEALDRVFPNPAAPTLHPRGLLVVTNIYFRRLEVTELHRTSKR